MVITIGKVKAEEMSMGKRREEGGEGLGASSSRVHGLGEEKLPGEMVPMPGCDGPGRREPVQPNAR